MEIASQRDDKDGMLNDYVERFPCITTAQDNNQNNIEEISISSAESNKDEEPEDKKTADNNDWETEPEDSNEIADNTDDKIVIEDRGYEVVKPKNDDISTELDNNVAFTRHERVIKKFDCKKCYPYFHFQEDQPLRWTKPYYYEEADVMFKLDQDNYYRNSCFEENIAEQNHTLGEVHVKIKEWDDEDQCRMCREVMD